MTAGWCSMSADEHLYDSTTGGLVEMMSTLYDCTARRETNDGEIEGRISSTKKQGRLNGQIERRGMKSHTNLQP